MNRAQLPGSPSPRPSQVRRGGRVTGHAGPAPGSSALGALLSRWRAEAELLRRRGAGVQADVLAGTADELEAALREHALEQLTVTEAARESGFSPSALRRRFPGQRTIARGALPQKGARAPADGPDLAGALLAQRATP